MKHLWVYRCLISLRVTIVMRGELRATQKLVIGFYWVIIAESWLGQAVQRSMHMVFNIKFGAVTQLDLAGASHHIGWCHSSVYLYRRY
jgi:hypothetical protein